MTIRPEIMLNEAQKAEVETLAAVLNTEQIADYFGVSRRTFLNIRNRDPEVDALYKKGKARAIGVIAQSLIQKARAGDTACMIFYLKTQAGWRETAPVEHEDGGKAGTDPKDELDALLKSIAERGTRAGGGMALSHDAPGKPLT